MRHSSCHTQGYLGKATLGAHGHHRNTTPSTRICLLAEYECRHKELHRKVRDMLREQNTAQQRETLIPHERSSQPWAKVGIDMFSLDKRNFLITVD